MGIGRLELIAILLVACSGLPGCEQIRRAKECRGISELVNPTLRAIDVERTKNDDAAAYARIALAYESLAGKLVARRYTQKRVGDAAVEYAKLCSEASRDARTYSDALAAKDPARTALARAAAGHTAKKESAALLRIDGACTVR
jgi:hypothetical protein